MRIAWILEFFVSGTESGESPFARKTYIMFSSLPFWRAFFLAGFGARNLVLRCARWIQWLFAPENDCDWIESIETAVKYSSYGFVSMACRLWLLIRFCDPAIGDFDAFYVLLKGQWRTDQTTSWTWAAWMYLTAGYRMFFLLQQPEAPEPLIPSSEAFRR